MARPEATGSREGQALTADQVLFLRLKAQRLLPGAPSSVSQALQAVLAVQAQELPAAQLSLRARSQGLTTTDVQRAQQVERSIAWTWCLRGTLHLITTADAAWLIPFLGPAYITADARRLRELGWEEASTEAGIRLLNEALARGNALTRAEIVALLRQKGLPFEGQAPVHLLYRAALQGLLCAVPHRGSAPTYTLYQDWLGDLQPLPRLEALADLALRYLEAYAPAAPEDLASWSGLKPAEARQAWQIISEQLIRVDLPGISGASPRRGWMLRRQAAWLETLPEAPFDTAPAVRLLPRYDTYWLGYASRQRVVDPQHARRVHPGGGVIHPVLLVNGRAAGVWKVNRRRGALEVLVEPFGSLAENIRAGIEIEAADLGRFLQEAILLWIAG